MVIIKSLCCTQSSCVREFEGRTDDGKEIFIYYRSGLLKVGLNGVDIITEDFFSPNNKHDLCFASLDEIQERLIFHGINFPKNCTLSGLLDEFKNS